MLNIYSNSSHTALKYLEDTEVNINNVLIMTGDFNIRNNFWDPNFPHHSYYKDTLFEIADSLGLEISKPIENIPTRYSDNSQDTDSVIDLIFLHPNSSELDNYHIYLNWRLSYDHTPISINISILEEHI